MNIVLHTRQPAAASAAFYSRMLGPIAEVRAGLRDRYDDGDVALFMTYAEDIRDLAALRRTHPRVRIGIVDARGSQVFPAARLADFLMLDSLEMRDFFAVLDRPVFTYLEYPEVLLQAPVHRDKDELVIGYHGNRTHLNGMFPRVTMALEALAAERRLRLIAVYNVRAGRWRIGVPRNLPVEHVQWTPEVYAERLARVDIGIAPALIPVRGWRRLQGRRHNVGCFGEGCDDYLLRFKMPSNAGRLVVFGRLGIPVVADFLPSFLQVIRDGENGYLAHSAGGWHRALRALAESADTRNRMATVLQRETVERYGVERQNREFLEFLARLPFHAGDTVRREFRPDLRRCLAHRRSVGAESALWSLIKAYRVVRRLPGCIAANRRGAATETPDALLGKRSRRQ